MSQEPSKEEKAQKIEKEPEEGISLQALNKEVDMFSTDPALIHEIDRDFLDVVREFSGDPDLELFKIKYETIYNSLKESAENEILFFLMFFFF